MTPTPASVAARLRLAADKLDGRVAGMGLYESDAEIIAWYRDEARAIAEECEGLERVKAAAQALVDQLDVVGASPEFRGLITLAHTHGIHYVGPGWGDKREDLRHELLRLAPPKEPV